MTPRTSTGSNVLSLGLRSPALLAKAAATLQVITGGRVVLGVGAGEPARTAALGGPHHTVPESVAAFEEGVGLIRRLWQPPAGEIDHDGRFHRISGVRFGPVPEPAVPLWVGAFGPRMLALTGRYADGWLPTNAFLDLADVPKMQHRIDLAAAGAGRDPAQIRRVFNVMGQITEAEPPENGRRLAGPVDFWVDALRDYRDRLGFDSFVFWPNSDRPGQTRLFLEQVRPRLAT